MADDMCGPSNGLKGLSRHLDGNRSEQRDRITNTGFQHPFAQDQRPRQDATFARFQQGTASLAEANPTDPLQRPLLPVPTHGYNMPGPYSPMLSGVPPLPLSNTMSNAQVQGSNNTDLSQYYPDSTRTFAGSMDTLNQAHQGPSVQAGPSSRPPTTAYPLNRFPAPSMMPFNMHSSYRPMFNPMAGGMAFNNAPSPLQHQQPQVANAAPATDDFDFDAELSAWMERNSLQDQPQASEEPQEGARDKSEDQAHDSEETVPVDVGDLSEQPSASYDRQAYEQLTAELRGNISEYEASNARQWRDAHQVAEELVDSFNETYRREYMEAYRKFYARFASIQALPSSVTESEYRELLRDNVEILRADITAMNSRRDEDMELANAAQGLLDAVSKEQSDKFRNSHFVDMLRKIAAHDLVVRDNKLVDPEAPPAEGGPAPDATGETAQQ
ncbi:hypothetical protein F5Y06DRAFT_277420 [Hypoxylon sp. FL0890]|nr:hypothetical protein F5Y06DRAFT_277420 [Hypoxylon sp. FL0890]